MNAPELPEVYYTYTKHILSGNLRSEQLLVRHQLGHLTLNWPSCWNFASRSWRSVKSGVPKIHKVYLHGFNTSKVYAWMNNCMDFTNLMYSNYSRLENNVQWINQCQSFMYNWSWSGFWNIIFTYPIFQGLTSAKSTTSLVIYFRRNKVYASWKLYKTSISVNRGSHCQVRFVWQVWDGQLSPSFKYIRF